MDPHGLGTGAYCTTTDALFQSQDLHEIIAKDVGAAYRNVK
jgi:hypothetical protein